MIVGFTGTREGATGAQREALAALLAELTDFSTAIHGDCVGADVTFSRLARDLGLRVEAFPANVSERWRARTPADLVHPPAPALRRNRTIVDRCDLLIAVPREEREILRSGSWATIRYARKIGRRTIILLPNGKRR